MSETTLVQELAFLVTQRQQDEATVLAQAVQAGVRVLYREALIEAYLMGRIPRQEAAEHLGPDALEENEYQRDALQRDVLWGTS